MATEIAKSYLWLTCDPMAEIHCIKRNVFDAIKAINAVKLALKGSICTHVMLDEVIATM